MIPRLFGPILLGLAALGALSAYAQPSAHGEATDIAIIGCEYIAAHIDGDPNDGTLPEEEDLACRGALPPTGPLSVAALESSVGNGDGVLTRAEIESVDEGRGNRMDETCTYHAVVVQETKAAMGCTLLVVAFVDDEAPVTLDLDAGLTSVEASGATTDFICDTEGMALGKDADCSNANPIDGDGVVMFRVLNATGTNGDEYMARVAQEAVEYAGPILLADENDPDGDGIPNQLDNCQNDFNPSQTNTDNAPIVTAGIGPADVTIPNNDFLGDACDPDDDNDGIFDWVEAELGAPVSPPSNPTCLATAGGTNPLMLDTDGDRVTDYAECLLGSNPLSAASRPAAPQFDADGDGLSDALESAQGFSPTDPDSDDDGIPDGMEFKGYGTSPIAFDTDGDLCPDGLEIASIDTNKVVNSNDLLIVAVSFASTIRPNMDMDKNGVVNSNDLLIVAVNYGSICGLPD
jgi:hypothetical protein